MQKTFKEIFAPLKEVPGTMQRGYLDGFSHPNNFYKNFWKYYILIKIVYNKLNINKL